MGRSRIGLTWEIALIVVAVLAVGGIDFVAAGASVVSPTSTALAYMAAVADRDADSADRLSHVDVSGLSTGADRTLLSDAAHRAFLAEAPVLTQPRVASIRAVGHDREVSVTYQAGGVPVSTKLTLTPTGLLRLHGLLSSWSVLVVAARLTLAGPPVGRTSVDGLPIDLGPGQLHDFAVWPGRHHVEVKVDGIYRGWSADVDAAPAPQGLTVTPLVGLTDAAKAQATPLVKKAFTDCVASTAPMPPGCPQQAMPGPASVAWKLFGDPLAGAVYALRPDLMVGVTGHFQMTATPLNANSASVTPTAVGGPYRGVLTTSNGELAFKDFESADDVADAPRPAVEDAALFTATRSGLISCLALHLLNPPGCPNHVAVTDGPERGNIAWSAAADPITAATAQWDGHRSTFVVVGQIHASYVYDSLLLYGAPLHSSFSNDYSFRADLYWDGIEVVFAGFEPS